ncbi:hypothetical protein [Flavobacterium terrigena]|uniref:Right handed beta helix region n=1 Tax=Flavobacterium terrigena TaxID=402734 RepID=A0A1H6YDR0_9FLAO|nr:hypothetical protein [Flavobacterium terrigena]SEJ35320.1 hypothetical protein SAMN05660918_0105 [Flavobacterium terrigena]
MRQFKLLLGLITIFSFTSCRNELDFESSIGDLSFSKETVYLDTVFTNIGSSTYTLKVYNNSNKNISIPSVRLGKGQASNYQLMVDGVAGKEFENVELLAKDSMFVFISVNSDVADANPTDFLYTDEIQFGNGGNFQKVNLVTLIQDAVFIYPERTGSPNNFTYEQIQLGVDGNGDPIKITGTNLSHTDVVNGDELHWTNTKPYVVYGYAKIPENEDLIIDQGTKVHFHANSGLIVADDASLVVNGDLSTYDTDGNVLVDNEVVFEGDRLEPNYAEVPGQWGTVWFLPGSNGNNIKNLTIKNATVGMLVSGNDGTPTPTIDMTNTQIYNCTNVGILARTGNLTGKNVVINNCGQASLACTEGGSYDFTHCTFANYWSSPNQTCLVLNDFYKDGSLVVPVSLTKADFKNCIFYGSSNISIDLEKKGTTFEYQFNNCLIKFVDFNNQFINGELYSFTSNPNYSNCILSLSSNTNSPKFKNSSKNKLNILLGSAAIGMGIFDPLVPDDILGNSRATSCDIGAYQYLP